MRGVFCARYKWQCAGGLTLPVVRQAIVAVPSIGAGAPRTLISSIDHILGDKGCQYAFAQATVGHPQGFNGPHPEHRLHDGAACQDEIGPLLADARLGGPLLVVHAGDALGHLADALGRKPAAVDLRAVIFGKPQVNARDGGDGARGAEQVRAARLYLGGDRVALVERLQRGLDEGDHFVELVALHEGFAEALRKRHHAEGQGGPGLDGILGPQAVLDGDALRRPLARQVEPDEFRGAAADVENQDVIALLVDERGAAGDGEARFGLAANNLQRKARLPLDPRNEVAAVLGDAAGLGGNQANVLPPCGPFWPSKPSRHRWCAPSLPRTRRRCG